MEDAKKLIEEVNAVLGRDDSVFLIYLYSLKYSVIGITAQKVVDFYNDEIVPLMKADAEQSQRVINAMFNNENDYGKDK